MISYYPGISRAQGFILFYGLVISQTFSYRFCFYRYHSIMERRLFVRSRLRCVCEGFEGLIWAQSKNGTLRLRGNLSLRGPLSGEDGGGDGGGRILPEHPSPILHAPRDNISCKGNPSLPLFQRKLLRGQVA